MCRGEEGVLPTKGAIPPDNEPLSPNSYTVINLPPAPARLTDGHGGSPDRSRARSRSFRSFTPSVTWDYCEKGGRAVHRALFFFNFFTLLLLLLSLPLLS